MFHMNSFSYEENLGKEITFMTKVKSKTIII